MINLRYHIVSITAVFLALAVGVVMGAAFIDQGTVDLLQDRLDGLESDVSSTRGENRTLRDILDELTGEDSELEAILLAMLEGTLEERSIVPIAFRGIDEDSVDATVELVVASGADVPGVIWIDAELDLADDEVVDHVSEVTDTSGQTAQVRDRFVGDLAEALLAVDLLGGTPDGSSDDTSDEISGSEAETEGEGETGASGGAAAAERETSDAQAYVEALVEDGLLEVEQVGEDDGSSSEVVLPEGEVTFLLLGGEGAEVPAETLLQPLVTEMASAGPVAVVVAEVMRPRSIDELVDLRETPDDADPPPVRRGDLVDLLRSEESLDERLSTVDNADEVLGRLAVVLALAEVSDGEHGDYGVAESAQAPFPAEG